MTRKIKCALFVEVVKSCADDDGKEGLVIMCLGPFSPRKARDVEFQQDIDLDHSQYRTQIVEESVSSHERKEK